MFAWFVPTRLSPSLSENGTAVTCPLREGRGHVLSLGCDRVPRPSTSIDRALRCWRLVNAPGRVGSQGRSSWSRAAILAWQSSHARDRLRNDRSRSGLAVCPTATACSKHNCVSRSRSSSIPIRWCCCRHGHQSRRRTPMLLDRRCSQATSESHHRLLA
jgi:hypothetical protein